MQVIERTHNTAQAETQSSCLNVALVGGGSDCRVLIQFLEAQSLKHFNVHIAGVADPLEEAPALMYAKEKGIFTTNNYRDLFALENLHLIIEITGKEDVFSELMRTKPEQVKVMDHVSARLFWELMELQEQKARCERKLVRSDRVTSVGRMASYLAHEIRNPLVSIGGFADNILEAPDLPESLKPKAQIIVDQVRRLEKVLKNMWEYVRPSKQKWTTSNYNALAERVFRVLESECRSRAIELTLELDRCMPDTIFDVDLMFEALLSVARRLMAFMKSGLQFALRTEVCWDSVGISLEENSGEISSTALENMFNPFSDHEDDNAALTASMSKKIVDDHGGDIKIEHEPGVRTVVVIELPIERKFLARECPQDTKEQSLNAVAGRSIE
jgi:nitrogen-specific signal transduction histidine kinase